MKLKLKYLILLPLVAIISCGYSTSYLVEGNRYTSAVFEENYYRHWDNELKSATKVDAIDVTDKKITSFSDLYKIDPNLSLPGAPANAEEYGVQYKMNSLDDSFYYGYQSKLFDGQMVCGAQDGHLQYAFQLGRVQIDSNGFSVRFSKESSELHYFAMQFKATTDNTVDCYPIDSEVKSYYGTTVAEHNIHDDKLINKHESTFDLTITLYTRTNKGIVAHPFMSHIELLGTVNGEPTGKYKTNNGHFYTFFAFDLEDLLEEKLSRLVGVSVTFDNVDDALINHNKNREDVDEIKYALFLYEMFFPYTSWN